MNTTLLSMLAASSFGVDAASQPALPAPHWFIQIFKGLGFFLHQIPMHLWLAGTLIAVALGVYGCAHGKAFSRRFLRQLPFLVALGINFGIVPLLFIQVLLPKAFYNATILVAWPWLFVIGLLIPAYYGIYIAASVVKKPATPEPCDPTADGDALAAAVCSMTGGSTDADGSTDAAPCCRRCCRLVTAAAGWVAAGCLVLISLIFATGFSVLVAGPERWTALWESTGVAGAVTGLSMNLLSVAFWSRWLMTVGLALGTLGAWTTLDAAFFADGESPEYRRWSQRFALALTLGQAVIGTAAGAVYVWTWNAALGGGWLVIAVGAAVLWAPLALWTVSAIGRWREVREWLRDGTRVRRLDPPMAIVSRTTATLLVASQAVVLLLHTIARQWLQNVQLDSVYSGGVLSQPVAPQWGPIALFLVCFIGGAATIGWMVRQILRVTLLKNRN